MKVRQFHRGQVNAIIKVCWGEIKGTPLDAMMGQAGLMNQLEINGFNKVQ